MGEQFEFTALSVYTGPTLLKPIISNPDCPWIVGRWDAANNDMSAAEIKKDIDQRIAFALNVFQSVLPLYKTYNRHFAIPEFFFRCKQGPYPYLKVDGVNYPLEYIRLQMLQKLQQIIPKDNNYYYIILGSVLTSNVADYDALLSSAPVQERLAQLNQIVASTGKANLADVAGPKVWRRVAVVQPHLLKASPELDALNAFMTQCRGNPLCTVRNRGLFFEFNASMMDAPACYIYEKQYESTVDLTMGLFDGAGKIVTGGMLTEWMANYPSYSILSGDKQTTPYATNARFTPPFMGYVDVGVEICLDHRMQRLRRTVDMTVQDGAAADNYPLFKQLIPSGGMQILDYAAAAERNCVMFNADGCDKIYYVYTDPNSYILNGNAGLFKGITCGVYNQSVQSKWTGNDGNTYYSHSQLAFTTNTSRIGGFDNALGLNNVKAQSYYGTSANPSNPLTDSYTPTVKTVGGSTPLFGAGTGEVHNYFPQP
jgi:hypothetical protein